MGNVSGNITASNGSISYISVYGSVSGNITAGTGIGNSWIGVDMTGNITCTSGNLTALQVGRDLTGRLMGTSDTVGELTIGRHLSGGAVQAGTFTWIAVGEDIDSAITAQQSIGYVQAGRNINGNITASNGTIDLVAAGSEMWRDSYTVAGSISNLTISAQSVGSVSASAALGYTAYIQNVTITASNGSIDSISAVSGISGNVTASDSISYLNTQTGDITGNFTATNGDISAITVSNGSLLANLTAGGNIGVLYALNDITGNITAGGDIGNGTIFLHNIPYGGITALTGSIAGNITASNGSIGAVMTGLNLMGTLSAYASLGEILCAGNISATITAGSGGLTVLSLGNIISTLTAEDSITVVAVGNISGNITVIDQGDIQVTAIGNIDSTMSAPGDITAAAVGNFSGMLTSTEGNVYETAGGTLSAQATAPLALDANALDISGSTFTFHDTYVTGLEGVGAGQYEFVCFAAGTLILMADGTTKPIETMEAGDQVWACPEGDAESTPAAYSVQEVYHNRPAQIYHVMVSGETLRTTAQHPFYVKSRGWVAASALASGDQLRTRNGEWCAVDSVEDSGLSEPVYNFNVESAHTYFVLLAEGSHAVLVHNSSSLPSPQNDALQTSPPQTYVYNNKVYIYQDGIAYPEVDYVITSENDLQYMVFDQASYGHTVTGSVQQAILSSLKGGKTMVIQSTGAPSAEATAAIQTQIANGALEKASVGAPGTLEGLIPIWGSGRSAIHDFQTGHPIYGLIQSGLAITDIFLLKSLVTAGGKLIAKAAIEAAGEEATQGIAKAAANDGVAEGLRALSTEEKGVLGEEAARKALTRAGYKELSARLAGNQGFDGVWVKYAPNGSVTDIILTESKFSSTGVAKLSGVGASKQLSTGWIDNTIARMLRSGDPTVEATGKLLEANKLLIRTKFNVLAPDMINRWFLPR